MRSVGSMLDISDLRCLDLGHKRQHKQIYKQSNNQTNKLSE